MAGELRERNGRLQRPQHTQADAHDRSIVAVTVRITTSYLANNPVPSKEIGPLIRQISQTLVSLRDRPQETAPQKRSKTMAVGQRPTREEIRASIRDRALISFKDKTAYRMLKRHLTNLDLTPEAYRAKR